MKKVFTILAAILMLAFSVVPVFAEEVKSPEATKASYVIEVGKPESGHGYRVDYEIKSEIKEDGRQTVKFYVTTDDDTEFIDWIIEGDYDPDQNLDLSKPEIELEIFGPVKVVPNVKTNEPTGDSNATQPTTAVVVSPSEGQPATSGSDKGKTSSGTQQGGSGSAVVAQDKGSKSPQTGSDNTIAYVVLLASTAVCCAAVIKYSKSK